MTTVARVSPWHELAERPDITVHFADLPRGLRGFCDHETRSIWISTRLRQRQRAAVAKHELIHLDRGPVFPHWQEREEREVEEATARALIPFAALLDALRWTRDANELADELHVPADLIRVRAKRMRHPAELSAIATLFADLAELGAV